MDKAEFERLYRACETSIQRFAYYKLPSKADGDDVLQEALLAAYRNRESIKSAAAFKPWLLAIVANKCNDFYRSRAKLKELPLEETIAPPLSQSRYGLTVADTVQETLEQLSRRDVQILRLFYLESMPQAEIAQRLNLPVGTVKSRLFAAKQRFKAMYPFPPALKGAPSMSKLPTTMPKYSIVPSTQPPFPVKWEELMGWFIVPRIGEKLSWAMYDTSSRKRSETYEMKVTGRASVHGIEGVEIVAYENRGGEHEGGSASRDITRTFVAQLTDTHCRILCESHADGDIKRLYTFLDADEFLPNWGFGEDNCGNETALAQKGTIVRSGNAITTASSPFLLDVVGRYTVIMEGKAYDCICVMDVECYNTGVVTEQFIDAAGRTVLWRRFNRDNWKFSQYKQMWSDRLPDNEQLTVDGETYVHWYDCITDYVL